MVSIVLERWSYGNEPQALGVFYRLGDATTLLNSDKDVESADVKSRSKSAVLTANASLTKLVFSNLEAASQSSDAGLPMPASKLQPLVVPSPRPKSRPHYA